MLLNDALRIFLDSIGRSEEYEYYIKKFQSDRSACFSVICPDLEVLESKSEYDLFLLNIKLLLRLELIPAVLLSGPLSRRMESSLRIHAQEREGQCFEFLEAHGSSAEWDAETLRAHVEGGVESARRKKRCLVFRTDWPLASMIARAAPFIAPRMLFLRSAGSLRTHSGEIISLYRMMHDIPRLAVVDIPLRELAIVGQKSGMSGPFAVASPVNMLREIFTVKGAGTIMRKGSEIRRIEIPTTMESEGILKLIEESFKRKLRGRDIIGDASCIYLERDFRGAILIESTSSGYYMSKFAAAVQARGEGIAQDLWERVSSELPKIFWRSRAANSVNRWYSRLADGRHESHGWRIYWKGVTPEAIPDIIAFCLERSEDFEQTDLQ